ncbi:hypothetical protein Dsin_022763 [Dipteronia sinensis]|uniref:Reverse transcriptase zinc-binding domain-containing protein n=1 Tax=Dipteronia sinensis TaxID=43782 RepID=A0AAE0A1Z4_9ROSI|nr:hypothetical protein Dsin_022763 [Dipteronia sinensis]
MRREDLVLVRHLKTETCGWNEQLINHIFLEHDASTILSILVRCSITDDSLCWHYTEDEEFTVKSSVKVGSMLSQMPSNSIPKASGAWWKNIWNVCVPAKVRILIWMPAVIGVQPRLILLAGRFIHTVLLVWGW